MQNTPRLFKDAIYEQFARIGKALSSPKRLELLDLLCQGERTVEVLAKEASLTIANASQHLQVLRQARLVQGRKKGLFVTYRIGDQDVSDFFRAVRSLAESHLAEIERTVREFLRGREGMEPVDRETLLERAHSGEVTVLDVRPVEEYRSGHIPGALSVPLEKLERYLPKLPREREIVAYCRGPYCVLAIRAVEILRSRGFRARRLAEGIPELRSKGYPVAVGGEGGGGSDE